MCAVEKNKKLQIIRIE